MDLKLISRKEAFDLKLKRFFTGRECKRGHLAQRFVSTGNCVACCTERSRAFVAEKNYGGGKFAYPLSSQEDHAAAWAFCQALDLARGAVPTASTIEGVTSKETAADIKAIRKGLYGPNADGPPPSGRSEMAPEMAAQLRYFGLLK